MLVMRSGHESLPFWLGGTAMEDKEERLTFPPPRDDNACCHPFPTNVGWCRKARSVRVPTVGNVRAC